MEFNYPFQIDKNGKTAIVTEEAHLRQMVEQVLFTTPGERVNRPTFGSGINQLVFAPLSDELVTATQVLVQAALQHWLGDLIAVNSVQVTSEDSTLQVRVQYVIKKTQQAQVAQFTRRV
jgi:phage baseplate assembly protein W